MKTLIIGCGGVGSKRIYDLYKRKDELGKVDFLMFDTSDSDRDDSWDFPEDKILQVPGLDGQGKIRKDNAEELVEFVNANFSTLPEADHYILCYTTFGGSGSVMGPQLAYKLTEKERNCVSVVLADLSSGTNTENTMKVLNGLANHVKKLEKPIHVVYYEQGELSIEQADDAMIEAMMDLNMMSSFRNIGLDTADLKSFYRYDRKGVDPRLTLIERFTSIDEVNELDGKLLTTLTMSDDSLIETPKVNALMDIRATTPKDLTSEIHFATSTINMAGIAKTVSDRWQVAQDTKESLNTKDVFGSGSDGMDY